jgi:hypothetical protein
VRRCQRSWASNATQTVLDRVAIVPQSRSRRPPTRLVLTAPVAAQITEIRRPSSGGRRADQGPTIAESDNRVHTSYARGVTRCSTPGTGSGVRVLAWMRTDLQGREVNRPGESGDPDRSRFCRDETGQEGRRDLATITSPVTTPDQTPTGIQLPPTTRGFDLLTVGRLPAWTLSNPEHAGGGWGKPKWGCLLRRRSAASHRGCQGRVSGYKRRPETGTEARGTESVGAPPKISCMLSICT